MPKHRPAPRAASRLKPKPHHPKPAADRSELSAAERAIVELEARRKEEEQEFRRLQVNLKAEIAEAREQYEKRRLVATAAVDAARKAYRDAGGVK